MNKGELIDHAQYVNSLLTKYIRIHDKYIKESGSFLSLFRSIDFGKLSGEAYEIFRKLQEEEKSLEGVSVTEDYEKFYSLLLEYTKTLKETAYLLFQLLKALDNKARGEALSFKEHKKNGQKYEESIEKYTLLGEKLNTAYKSLS